MKKIILIAASFLSLYHLSAQVESKKLEVKNIVSEQNYVINSLAKAEFAGGRNRITIPVQLPANTVEWLYVFSCSSSDNGQGIIQLCSNLTKAMDGTGVTSEIINAVTAPNGDSYCDVYLLDRENKGIFESTGEGYKMYTIGTRHQLKNGVIPITGLNKGVYYIGIENNDATTAINVRIEVAALVENTEVDNNQWSVEKKNEMYEFLKAACLEQGMDESSAKTFSSCMIKKVVAETTPEAISHMAEFERDELIARIHGECLKEIGN